MGREVLQTSDMTSDLEESIVNQYKVPKKKVSTGKPKQGPYSWWDVVIRGRGLSFVQILDQLTFLKGFPRWLSGKEFACQCRRCRRHRFDPSVGKILGGGNGNLLRYSCLENSINKGAYWAMVCVGHKKLNTTEWLSMHTQPS